VRERLRSLLPRDGAVVGIEADCSRRWRRSRVWEASWSGPWWRAGPPAMRWRSTCDMAPPTRCSALCASLILLAGIRAGQLPEGARHPVGRTPPKAKPRHG